MGLVDNHAHESSASSAMPMTIQSHINWETRRQTMNANESKNCRMRQSKSESNPWKRFDPELELMVDPTSGRQS